ncbi:hypothetical protein MITSMUL_04172 [Mitsuokella multacida DSM 20544]|uniref:Flp/Fap pilin component n=1 Tax=Mitsuokella multacida DSM 20544 TaxID=500635 RepID=C9KLT8_9FIRM|nr:hypothetical protein MITSMUL_04172 [Mitsuokella multacida DSM 20544]
MSLISLLSYMKRRYLSERGQGIVEYALLLIFLIGIFAFFMSPYFRLRYRLIYLQIIGEINKIVS